MPRGKSLNDFKKGQILAKHTQGLSNRQIGRDLNRSEGVARSFVNDPSVYGSKTRRGRDPLLSPREKRMILREATNNVTTFTKIKADLKLLVSPETIRRVISKSKFIKW